MALQNILLEEYDNISHRYRKPFVNNNYKFVQKHTLTLRESRNSYLPPFYEYK